MKLPQLSLFTQVTRHIGIDVGTSRIRIWSDQEGVVVDEPSCAAVDLSLNKVIAVGREAQEMIGRVKPSIQIVFPISQGVIGDPELARAMLQVFLQRLFRQLFFFRPVVMVSVPAVLHEPEKKAFTELFFRLGVREVNFVSQVLAAAIGAGVPIADASGCLVLQMGAGLVEVAIISLGSIVHSEVVSQAGLYLDESIQKMVREKFGLRIGFKTSERLKQGVGGVAGESRSLRVVGQDVVNGTPKEVIVNTAELAPLLEQVLSRYVHAVKAIFTHIPAELTADVIDKGVLLSGGLAQLQGLESYFIERLGVPVAVVDDPGRTVIHGIGQILQNFELFRESVGYVTNS